VRTEKQLSTKNTKWGKQAFCTCAKARKITNKSKSKRKPMGTTGKLMTYSGICLYFVPFVFFVDLFWFVE